MTSIKFIACVTQNTLFYMLARNILLIRNLGGLKSESEVSQSCPTLCDPMDCSPPGSSVHGISQARILEWVAISFSRGFFLTQGSNPGLWHCRQTLYRLSHQGILLNFFLLATILFQWIVFPICSNCTSK